MSNSISTASVAGPATRYERRGSAAWIRLTRPERRNAINPEVIDGINAGLDDALADRVRAVVLTGSEGVFCAGADLKHVLGVLDDLSGVERLLADAGALMRRIETHPTPVIAAVNGVAIAGGLELVLACDLVVAAESATLADGHATYGLFPGAGGSVRLPRIVGATRARHLLFTGRSLTAAEMRELGVVNEVVPLERLEHMVDTLCERLARTSAGALTRMKRVVREGLDLPLDAALALELEQCREHLRSADVAEGLAAFAAGRRPVFGGEDR